MVTQIQNNIALINKALSWIKTYKPETYETSFLQLVEERRKMRTMLKAENDNPGIAAFGKSQVGKSYLMSCILQDKGKPFMVKANGKEYNFINTINPIGEDKEATGVVTRFSSYKLHPEMYSGQYPVLVRNLSITDIVLILSDCYYNDFSNYTCKSETEINQRGKDLYSSYNKLDTTPNALITADDILDIKYYFCKHINNAQGLNHSSYFDKLALIIDKVPENDYIKIFNILWDNNPNIVDLYKKLYAILSRLNFKEYVYLPIESVVHNGIKENTIMSVECLKHMLDDESSYTTPVYSCEGNGMNKICELRKSEICAVCSEVIYKIGEEFLSSTASYCMDGITSAVRSQLSHDEIQMSLLSDNDLLDFPGARTREQEDTEKLASNIIKMNCFLRGKVAYLFNHYNDSLAINILLYCHNTKNNDVTNLWKLLRDWINTYLGDSPQKRAIALERSGGISPLFYIGTMFNLDLAYRTDNETANSDQAIGERWTARFDTVLFKECFHSDTVDWVKNWTAEGVPFSNSYLLRDYKYSGEGVSHIYDGFRESGREEKMYIEKEYYERMHRSFINSSTVKRLFADPELSWDVSATINNDGALYIIENLAKAAECMNSAREAKFKDEVNACMKEIFNRLMPYYESEDETEILKENIRRVSQIKLCMDTSCGKDNYFFGHLLEQLQIKESIVLGFVHDLMCSPRMIDDVNKFPEYTLIRNRCKESFKDCKSVDDYWKAFINEYRFVSQKDAQDYLTRNNLKAEELFKPEPRPVTNAAYIADKIVDKWIEQLRGPETVNAFTTSGTFDKTTFSYLIDQIIKNVDGYMIKSLIEERISNYVNVAAVHTANENLVADIIAGSINEFVNDMGYGLLSESEKNKVSLIAKEQNLCVTNYIGKDRKSQFSEEEMNELFETVRNGQSVTKSFLDTYNLWLEYVVVAFIAKLNVKNINHQANDALHKILEETGSKVA